MTAFLSVLYGLICGGYVISFLIDNDDFSNGVKVLMAIFSPIIAPLLFGVALGMLMLAKVKKETNRE
jgi:cytochrome bd-type quinol oxidase subunit 2